MKKITKKQYTRWFFGIVAVLALIRFTCIGNKTANAECAVQDDSIQTEMSMQQEEHQQNSDSRQPIGDLAQRNGELAQRNGDSRQRNSDGIEFPEKKHPIYSVPNFKNTFPDLQDVHTEAAMKYGVKSVANRQDAEHRKKELVYVGANPYFHIDRLSSSIPYLVPRASMLVQDIGKAFFDSLYVKHIPTHKIIVTSLLRTKEDVDKLRTRNFNATENSCHLYGTTVDICYNRYMVVSDPDGAPRRKVQNDTLKWVLSEVLRDFRNKDRCYVKYEVKQGCFHITVR